MERVVYQQMADLDDRHWWYRARRRILADLIRREAKLPAKARILEIGCGTGHNLSMLSGFGHVDGLELDEEAAALSEKRLGRKVMGGHLLEMADANHDGKVSLAEAQTAALAHFDKADLNHDGKITPDERQQGRQVMRIERRQG